MENKTKILVAVSNDLSTDQRMQRICSSLAKSGYKVTLIGRELSHSLPLVKLNFDQLRLKCKFNKGPFFYLEYNLKLRSYLKKNRADILYAVDLDTLWGVCSAAKSINSKLVFDAHEYFTEVPELQGKSFKKWVWRQIGKSSAKYVDLAFTVNESLRQILSKKFNIAFETIRNVPVFTNQIQDVIPEGKRLIYQGVLNEGRCIEDYIQMMDDLPKDISLHLYGTGDIEADLKRLAKNSTSFDRIHFHGKLRPEQLRLETPKAWLGLNLLEGGSLNYYYSLANKFFDYLHAGVPSINSPFPEYESLSIQYKFATISSKLDLVKSIVNLYKNESTYAKMKSACFKNAESFTWQKEEEKLINLFVRLKNPTSQIVK